MKTQKIQANSFNKIDISDLPNGIYFGSIVIDNVVVKMKKIVKK